ncbi:MAG: class I SAM-dependent methyltransferase [Eudoraea sp.]|nr:class I SAM-dependent methyltransferase [Eudoraea sp.]
MLDYQLGNNPQDISTYSSLDEKDTIPVSYLFRDFKDMPPLEQEALKRCYGDVLDIGCGAGSHSLYLKKRGLHVTSLDSSEGAISVCKQRGLQHVVCSDLLDFGGQQFDTLLLLMNGIGLVGKIQNLNTYLQHLKGLLKPTGQILFDSSDILYMYEEEEDGGFLVPTENDYYGEVSFVLNYKDLTSAPFSWIYLDYNTISRAAQYHGFQCELVRKGPHYDYLAKLSL